MPRAPCHLALLFLLARSAGGAALSAKPAVAPKIKFQYYQNDTVMTVSVMHKQAKPEETLLEIAEERLKVVVQQDDERVTVIDKKLFDKVVPDECKTKFHATRIDIKLKKKTAGISWHELEGVGDDKEEKRREKQAADAAVADAEMEVSKAATSTAPTARRRRASRSSRSSRRGPSCRGRRGGASPPRPRVAPW